MTTKTCTKCGETKPTDQFYKDRASKDGVRPLCKTCANAQNRAWKKRNPDKRKARDRAYRESNLEKCKARDRAYYEANREKINAYQLAYREAHREQANAYQLAYREAHRGRLKDYYRARYALVGNPGSKHSQEITARYATRTGDPWTTEEDKYIITGPGTYADKALHLSRTYSAVMNRAATLRQEQTV